MLQWLHTSWTFQLTRKIAASRGCAGEINGINKDEHNFNVDEKKNEKLPTD